MVLICATASAMAVLVGVPVMALVNMSMTIQRLITSPCWRLAGAGPAGSFVEGVQVRGEVHVAGGDPRTVLLGVHHPAQEILGCLRVLAVGEHAMGHGDERVVALAGGPLGIEAMLDHLAHLG